MSLGFPLPAVDYDLRSALHVAADEGRVEMVRFLLAQADVDVNATDRWGGTPLDGAVRGGHERRRRGGEHIRAHRPRAADVHNWESAIALLRLLCGPLQAA